MVLAILKTRSLLSRHRADCTKYTYDHRSRLTGASSGGATLLTEKYDPFDRHIATVPGTGSSDWYGYTGDEITLNTSNTGTVKNRFLQGPGTDEEFAQDKVGSGSRWLLTDIRGSVRDVANTSNSSVGHRVYDGFGKNTSNSGATTDTFFAYTGRYNNASTGLQNNRARWYDSSLSHQWMSEDPIGFAGGQANLRQYAGNEPSNNIDPEGLSDVKTPDMTGNSSQSKPLVSIKPPPLLLIPFGHHWIPLEVLRIAHFESVLSKKAQLVIRGICSGPTTPSHRNTSYPAGGLLHSSTDPKAKTYNTIIAKLLDQYIKENGITPKNKMTAQQAYNFGVSIMNGRNPTTGTKLHPKVVAFITEIHAQRLAYLDKLANSFKNATLTEVLRRGKLHLDQENRIEARRTKLGTSTNCLGNGMMMLDVIRSANRDFTPEVNAPYWFTDCEGESYMLAEEGIFFKEYYRIYSDGRKQYTTKLEWDVRENEVQSKWGYYDFWGKWHPGSLRKEPPHRPHDPSKDRFRLYRAGEYPPGYS